MENLIRRPRQLGPPNSAQDRVSRPSCLELKRVKRGGCCLGGDGSRNNTLTRPPLFTLFCPFFWRTPPRLRLFLEVARSSAAAGGPRSEGWAGGLFHPRQRQPDKPAAAGSLRGRMSHCHQFGTGSGLRPRNWMHRPLAVNVVTARRCHIKLTASQTIALAFLNSRYSARWPASQVTSSFGAPHPSKESSEVRRSTCVCG